MRDKVCYLATPIDATKRTNQLVVDQARVVSILQMNGFTVFKPYGAWANIREDLGGHAGEAIHVVDQAALEVSDCLLALWPVGVPSVGVPIEIDRAQSMGKPVAVVGGPLTPFFGNRPNMAVFEIGNEIGAVEWLVERLSSPKGQFMKDMAEAVHESMEGMGEGAWAVESVSPGRLTFGSTAREVLDHLPEFARQMEEQAYHLPKTPEPMAGLVDFVQGFSEGDVIVFKMKRDLESGEIDELADGLQRLLEPRGIRAIVLAENNATVWKSKTMPQDDLTIKGVQERIRSFQETKGWLHDGRTFGDDLMLWVTEVAEAMEDFRAGHTPTEIWTEDTYAIPCPTCGTNEYIVDGNILNTRCANDHPVIWDHKPCGVPSEFADTVIRILGSCNEWGIDLEGALRNKLEYNDTRDFRHGGKKL